jgi:hypothetical protein
MMTLQTIKEYRGLAAQHQGNVSARIITELLDEVQSYRDIINRLRSDITDKRGPYSDDTLMPFGSHKGECLGNVPDDYLKWWSRQPGNDNRSAIETDVRFSSYPQKAFAIQKLKMFDYVNGRLNHVETYSQTG